MCLKMLKSKTVIPFRIVAVILTLLCVCMCFWQSVGVSAYYRDDLDGDWGYDILDDGTLQVDYYAGDDDTVVIPATISGRRVKSVAEFTTAGEPSKIILSEGIKMLGEHGIAAASDDNNGIIEIILPNSLTYIGDEGLSDCYIKQINIPDSVTHIGEGAFSGCIYLEHIELPDSVTKIGLGAFGSCHYLESIKFPKYITEIPDYCADSCFELDNVVIPDKVTRIGTSAFSMDDGLRTVTIPLSVVEIGEEAFYSCDGLSTVYYAGSPEDFKKIKMDSSTRSQLTPHVVYGKSSEESSSYPIDEPSANTDPEAENYDYAINSDGFITIKKYKKNEENVLIPSTIQGTPVSEISDDAFADCTGIKSVVLPDNLKKIWSAAFRNCSSIKKITIPQNVAEIGYCAFENCTALDEIVLSDTITCIGRDAFKNTGWYNKQNEGILTLESGSGKKFIVGVKGNIPENTKLEIERGASYIAEDAFSGQTGIVEVTIPDTVEIIGSGAFMFCSNLKKVVIKAPITEIESSTFSSCESLESITIPSTVTSIGKWAFSQSNNLKEINYTGTEEQFKKIMIKDETFYGATYDIGVNYNYVIPEPEPDESSTEPEKSETLVVSQQSVSDESKAESSIAEKTDTISEVIVPENSSSESNSYNNTGFIIAIIIISVLFAAAIAVFVIIIINSNFPHRNTRKRG